MKHTAYRQGDVVLILVKSIPAGAQTPRPNLTLALGEVTGHSHRITVGGADLCDVTTDEGVSTYLSVGVSGALLTHEEHDKIALLVVDYVQLVQLDAGQQYGNRSVEVGLISSSLKRLARELNIPILVLSQLNRGPENRTDKRPTLSDFRESGAIEQDADIALLLHREGYYDKNADQTRAELNIAKQRNGPTSLLDLTWLSEEMRFIDSIGVTAHA